MDLDRDLLQRAKGRDRDEEVDDPGRRTNTDRMGPTAAGATTGLYPKSSPLAGATNEQPLPEPTFKFEPFDDRNVSGPPKHREKKGKQAEPKREAAHAPAPSAPRAADPKPSNKPGNTPPAAAAKPTHRTEGGEGGPTTAGHGSHPHGPVAAAATADAITSTTANPAPGDASPQRANVAIGETVTFHARTGASGAWTASASDNTPSQQGDTFVWKAPRRPGSVTITFTPTGGSARTKSMTVVAPSSISFRKLRDDPQPVAGAGMWTNLTFGPQNVDFSEVEWLEIPGEASNVQGYFEQLRLQEDRPLHHQPAKEGAPMSLLTGEHVAPNHGVDDHAFIGDNPPLTRTPGDLFSRPSYFPGQYNWVIPNHYRARGESGNGEHMLDTTQTFTIDQAGTVTVSKNGASASQALNGVADPNGMILTPFPTVAIAAGLMAGTSDNVGDQIKWGLARLSSYRAHDPASYQNLVTALRQISAEIYVFMQCTNTYSTFTRDDVVLTITGNRCWTDTFPINDGKTDSTVTRHVPWLSVIDPAHFTSNTHLTYHITAEGHAFEISLPLPFSGWGHLRDIPGSEGKYHLITFLRSA